MTYRIRAVDEAERRARRDLIELGDELRNARMTCGATQAEVGRTLKWSASKVRRIERGQRQSVGHGELARFASVVGLRYSGRLFIGDVRLRDHTQLAMLERYRRFATSHGWSCRIEEPLPITADRRAFDLVLVSGQERVAHEFISRLRDVQAQIRPILQKQRDSAIGTTVLVIRDTAENRRAVALADASLRDLFPASARAVLHAIRGKRSPNANGLVFWREERAGSDRRSPAPISNGPARDQDGSPRAPPSDPPA